MDGSVYSSARTTERNIVLTLAMMFAPTIEDSRQKTYHFFPVKGKVKLVIETDNRQVQTEGYVESNEPDIFSEAETAQISILPRPVFLRCVRFVDAFHGRFGAVRVPVFQRIGDGTHDRVQHYPHRLQSDHQL